MQIEAVPHDLDLERALLALIITDNAQLDRVDHVEGDHFFDLAYREVFLAARELRAEHQRVNFVTLGGRMGGDPLGGKATVLESLRQFSFNGAAPDAHDVATHLIGLFAARQMQAIGQRLADSVWDYRTKRGDVIEATLRELDALLAAERPQKRTLWDFRSGMDDMLRELDADTSRKFIQTGLNSLDALIGGLRRSDLIYLGGRPRPAYHTAQLTACAKPGQPLPQRTAQPSTSSWLSSVGRPSRRRSATRGRHSARKWQAMRCRCW